MCVAVRCESCQKITWSGCGQHVEEVMSQIPREDWCTCSA